MTMPHPTPDTQGTEPPDTCTECGHDYVWCRDDDNGPGDDYAGMCRDCIATERADQKYQWSLRWIPMS